MQAPSSSGSEGTSTVGLLVVVIKATSLTSLIGFVEVTRAGQLISGVTFQPLLTYSLVAVVYLALCLPLSILSRRLEERLDVNRSPELGH